MSGRVGQTCGVWVCVEGAMSEWYEDQAKLLQRLRRLQVALEISGDSWLTDSDAASVPAETSWEFLMGGRLSGEDHRDIRTTANSGGSAASRR
jgi:hypothetical protein